MRKIIYNKLDDIDVEPFEDEIVFIESEECRYIFKDNEWRNYEDVVVAYEVMEKLSQEEYYFDESALDFRLVVSDYDDLYSLSNAFNGQLAYVQNNQTLYLYKNKWVEIK